MLNRDTADPSEVCVPVFDVQIQEIEDNSMRQVAERAVVDRDSFPSIDHLQTISVNIF